MAEITRRRTAEFLRELFSILMAPPDGVRASEAMQQLASRFTLTPLEAAYSEPGSRRFEKIGRFATLDCVKAGWLVKGHRLPPMGQTAATGPGREPGPEV